MEKSTPRCIQAYAPPPKADSDGQPLRVNLSHSRSIADDPAGNRRSRANTGQWRCRNSCREAAVRGTRYRRKRFGRATGRVMRRLSGH
jgi:hypothetical protein